MIQIRGMRLSTLATAYAAAWRPVPHPRHVFFCVADHFEPDWNGATAAQQRLRIERWVRDYPETINRYHDSRGRGPQHTFFCPIECYSERNIENLARLVRSGHADIEVHLHHDDDNAQSLRGQLLSATETLHRRHGLLSVDAAGQIRFGFIHGNWALDNSHPDGRWCGVNNELSVLFETGCYADFTMPAAPHAAQTRTINSIYYAIDDPDRPKSHDTGVPVTRGIDGPPGSLLMIQGPLVVAHRPLWRKPRVENGNVAAGQPPTGGRIDDWLRAAVVVQGHPSWHFIKLHTHGAPEQNANIWLGEAAKSFHQCLRDIADRRGFQYYYVTARELAMLVAQAQQGLANPDFDRLDWPADPAAGVGQSV